MGTLVVTLVLFLVQVEGIFKRTRRNIRVKEERQVWVGLGMGSIGDFTTVISNQT